MGCDAFSASMRCVQSQIFDVTGRDSFSHVFHRQFSQCHAIAVINNRDSLGRKGLYLQVGLAFCFCAVALKCVYHKREVGYRVAFSLMKPECDSVKFHPVYIHLAPAQCPPVYVGFHTVGLKHLAMLAVFHHHAPETGVVGEYVHTHALHRHARL